MNKALVQRAKRATQAFLEEFRKLVGATDNGEKTLALVTEELTKFLKVGKVSHLGLIDDTYNVVLTQALTRGANLILPPTVTSVYLQTISTAFLILMFNTCLKFNEMNPVRARLFSLLSAIAFELYASWVASLQMKNEAFDPQQNDYEVFFLEKNKAYEGLDANFADRKDTVFKTATQVKNSFFTTHKFNVFFPVENTEAAQPISQLFLIQVTETIKTFSFDFQNAFEAKDIIPFNALIFLLKPIKDLGHRSALEANCFYAPVGENGNVKVPCKIEPFFLNRLSMKTQRGTQFLEGSAVDQRMQEYNIAFHNLLAAYNKEILKAEVSTMVRKELVDSPFSGKNQDLKASMKDCLDFIKRFDRYIASSNHGSLLSAHFEIPEDLRSWLKGDRKDVKCMLDGEYVAVKDIKPDMRFYILEEYFAFAASKKSGPTPTRFPLDRP